MTFSSITDCFSTSMDLNNGLSSSSSVQENVTLVNAFENLTRQYGPIFESLGNNCIDTGFKLLICKKFK